METSILSTIKQMLGIDSDYTAFDTDLIVNINSIFGVLTQIGVGPSTGFSISSAEEKWSDFLGETKNFEAVKTYMYIRVQLLFDPPTSSAILEARNRIANELEWRLNVASSGVSSP